MGAIREQQVQFWQAVENGLTGGVPVIDTLAKAGAAVSGTPLADAADAVAEDIKNGASMSEAMEKLPEVFSRAMCTMVRAGEAGGVLDHICGRVAKALEDGGFTPPGAKANPATEQERYCRALGWLISSGVPIVQAFSIIGEKVRCRDLAEATGAVHGRILEGESVAGAMREHPRVFPAEVCDAIAAGEEQGNLDEVAFQIADALKAGDLSTLPGKTTEVKATEDAAPVIRQVNRILLDALNLRASDIHLDPLEGGRLRVRVRVDGVLCELDPVFVEHSQAVTSRIKVMSSMDVAERRLPQDGRIMVEPDGRKLDIRVCVVPTMFGERVCMRLLSRENAPLQLDQIGLSESDLAAVRDLAHRPNGMVLANGPTGCGKTTLMYSMLHDLDRDKSCVFSVEDPIEYVIEGVAQMQIRPQHGMTFAHALRAVLRQDPDVVMIGEIRDLESMIVCVQTALTGHLVLTALHANDGPGAVRRMVDMGLEPFLVNSSVAGVISPRLVRTLCDKCKRPADPALHSLPPSAAEFVKSVKDATFFEAVGCDACVGGYRGRTAIYEVMVMDDKIREAIHSSSEVANIRNAAVASGMKTMLIDGLEKAAQGITSVAEVCRVVPR
jgi:general secretion pathway protein E